MSKSIVPSSPLTPLERLNVMMEDMFPSTNFLRSAWTPAVDIHETDKEIEFVMELPGMNRENFEVSLVEDLLIVKGNRKQEKTETGEGWVRQERSFGEFNRSFRLPGLVSMKDVDAEFRNGILTVKVPKTEPAKTLRIDVK